MARQRADYSLDCANATEPVAKERLHEMADGAAEQAREYGEKAEEAARSFKPLVEKWMQEQPMTTLAAAAAIGFALGALWKK